MANKKRIAKIRRTAQTIPSPILSWFDLAAMCATEENEDHLPYTIEQIAFDSSTEMGGEITPERILIAAVHLLLWGKDENGRSHYDAFTADPRAIRYRTPTEEEARLLYTPEMPKLEKIPGWDDLSEEKQEWLRGQTQKLIRLERLELLQHGIQPDLSGRPQ